MFLVGAVLGWLIEGVVMMTFFGTAEIPFPYTIAWTGLSWHALSLLFRPVWAQTALLRSFAATAFLSAALGIFWGAWSISWTIEAPASPAGVFSAHAWLATSGLILAFERSCARRRCFDLPRTAKLSWRPGNRVFPWNYRGALRLAGTAYASAAVRLDFDSIAM